MYSFRLHARFYTGLCGFLLGMSVAELAAGEMRTWKAAEGGFQVEAALTEQSQTHVKLKKKDGTELTVPREKLSKEDLEYLLFADPPLPEFAAKGKAPATKPATASVEKPEPKVESKSGTEPSKKIDPKKSAEPPATPPPAGASGEKKSEQKKTAVQPTGPDTFESIRRSFYASFDAVSNPDDQEPLSAGPGTNYKALVNELRKPIALPTFTSQSTKGVSFATAGADAWQQTSCLAAGGQMLLEYDAAGKQLLVWSIDTGKQVCAWKCGAPINPRCFAISPSGKYLAVGRAEGSIEVYDTTAKKSLRAVKVDKKHHDVFRVAFNWQEKSVFVLTQSADQMVFSLDGGRDLGGSLLRYLPEDLHSEEKPFRFDAKEDRIEFAVGADERLGMHLNENLHLSFDAAKHPRPLVFKTPVAYPPVLPVRQGNFAWVAQIAVHSTVQIIPKRPDVPGEVTSDRATRTLGKVERFSVDRDERFVWACHTLDRERVLEIVDVNYVQRPLKVVLPPPPGGFSAEDRVWVSAEKQRVVSWSPGSKQLTVYSLQNFAEPASWRLYSLVLQAFLEKRYEFLDGFFAELGKLALPLPGSERQLPLEEAVDFFSDRPMHVHPFNWRFRIQSWYKKHPDSIGPRFVLADQAMDEGWAARGGGVAATVTAEGWEKFRKAGDIAEKMLEPIMAQEQPPAYAFVMQHNVTKMKRRPAEAQVEIAKRCCKFYPECAEYHAGMVFNLLPRWYGKQGDSVAYADKISDLLGGGEAGDIAYAEMGYSLVMMQRPEHFVAATEFDTDRVTRGMLKAAQRTPDDARPYLRLMHWVFLMRFFNPNSELLDPELDAQSEKEYKQALVQFERLVARHDWTLYDIPDLALAEYSIYIKSPNAPPPKPKGKEMPNAN